MRTGGKALVTAGVLAVFVAASGRAQDAGQGPDAGRRRVAPQWGRGAGIMTESVAAVITNDVVAKAIGLTKEQQASIGEKLSADKARAALAAQQLAEDIVAILTDKEVSADLDLTEAQVNAVKQAITPELIQQALSSTEIQRLARLLVSGAMAGSAIQTMQERMQQLDKDGDGRLSDEERRAAMEEWRQRRGGSPRGASPQRGDSQQRQRGGQLQP